jgi:hypothetical protein
VHADNDLRRLYKNEGVPPRASTLTSPIWLDEHGQRGPPLALLVDVLGSSTGGATAVDWLHQLERNLSMAKQLLFKEDARAGLATNRRARAEWTKVQ